MDIDYKLVALVFSIATAISTIISTIITRVIDFFIRKSEDKRRVREYILKEKIEAAKNAISFYDLIRKDFIGTISMLENEYESSVHFLNNLKSNINLIKEIEKKSKNSAAHISLFYDILNEQDYKMSIELIKKQNAFIKLFQIYNDSNDDIYIISHEKKVSIDDLNFAKDEYIIELKKAISNIEAHIRKVSKDLGKI